MITDAEKKILEILRDLRAFEVVEIHKDKQGRPDFYLIKREQKIVIEPKEPKVCIDIKKVV